MNMNIEHHSSGYGYHNSVTELILAQKVQYNNF